MSDAPKGAPEKAHNHLEYSQELSENLIRVSQQYQEILSRFLARNLDENTVHQADPLNISDAISALTQAMMEQPARMLEAQMSLWSDYMGLWQNAALRAMGQEVEPYVSPETGDRRFKSDDWQENQIFDLIKQSYLVTARWFLRTVDEFNDTLDADTQHRLDFYTKQFVDALSPSNFIMTNPDVLKATVETKGENLVKGLQNILSDLEKGRSPLDPTMVNEEAFEVGENIATSPGKVVYQTDIMQLIQYEPATEKVFSKPLLIVPPWINKFYILDLQPKNSFIRWAVEKGYTVFVISWVNPDKELAQKTFEDYVFEGPLAALDAIKLATGEDKVNAIGYCIGGSLLAATLAYMGQTGDDRITAATFFTTQVDFTEAGDLRVFADEKTIQALDARMEEKGYLDASTMRSTFNMLRSNDLIWSFVVSNYLLGKEPLPFDLLYWNSDSTRMPRVLHTYYLREMYLNNRLATPGGIKIKGVPIDLSNVKIPVYLQAGKEDHIAPYPSVFKAVHHFKGETMFMLAGSGHIAGVINPPAAKKYQYWVNPKDPKDLEKWLETAEEHPGSWWPHWHKWLSRKSGPKVAARKPGDGELQPLEDAPGSFVKGRA